MKIYAPMYLWYLNSSSYFFKFAEQYAGEFFTYLHLSVMTVNNAQLFNKYSHELFLRTHITFSLDVIFIKKIQFT